MMKQYCRYCANASPADEDVCYCTVRRQQRNKANCIVENKCKSFEFNEIDVFDFELKQRYTPREKALNLQMSLKGNEDE